MTNPRADGAGTRHDGGGSLDDAIVRAHHDLLDALDFEVLGDDRFRATSERSRFGRTFGGQLLAQALHAAAATVTDQEPASLHAYFVRSGDTDEPLDIAVTRVRDGRSLSIRQVEITQDGQTLMTAIASFHTNPTEPELVPAPPTTPRPDELPVLQDWVHEAPPELAERSRTWVDRPPPLDVRIGEPLYFLGGPHTTGARSHWMRLPVPVDGGPSFQAALLAYASDYFLLDMAFRSHPSAAPIADLVGLSLDHAIWIHRPVNFDRWHLHTQELLAMSGERGLVRGSIHDDDGHLVASVTQEVLVRSAR